MQIQAEKENVDPIILALETLDLDPIKHRLMHPVAGKGWSKESADKVERDYKRFLTLVVKYPQENIALSNEVDEFWHQHILDTRKYAYDCERVFGYFLHHYPYFGLRGEDDAKAQSLALERTARIYDKEFGNEKAVTLEAYCMATAKPTDNAAYCMATGKPGEAAYCMATSKKADNAAYCMATGKPSEAAYCMATSKKADNAAYCMATAQHISDPSQEPTQINQD